MSIPTCQPTGPLIEPYALPGSSSCSSVPIPGRSLGSPSPPPTQLATDWLKGETPRPTSIFCPEFVELSIKPTNHQLYLHRADYARTASTNQFSQPTHETNSGVKACVGGENLALQIVSLISATGKPLPTCPVARNWGNDNPEYMEVPKVHRPFVCGFRT